MIGLEDQPRAIFKFLAHHVAEDAALAKLEVLASAVDFFLHSLGYDRKPDDLRMRVFERGTAQFAMVLEADNVAHAGIALQIADTFAEGPEQFLYRLL